MSPPWRLLDVKVLVIKFAGSSQTWRVVICLHDDLSAFPASAVWSTLSVDDCRSERDLARAFAFLLF